MSTEGTLSIAEAKKIIKTALLSRGWEVGKAWKSGIIHPSHPLRRWNLDAGRRVVAFEYRDTEQDKWKPLLRYMAIDLGKFIRDNPGKFNPYDPAFELSLEAKPSRKSSARAVKRTSKAPAGSKASHKASKKLSFLERLPDTSDPYITATLQKHDGTWHHPVLRPTSLDAVMSGGIEPWRKQFGKLIALRIRLERPFGGDSKSIPLANWSKRSGPFKVNPGAPQTLAELNKMRAERGLPPVQNSAQKKSVHMTAQKIEFLPGYELTPYTGVPCIGPRAVRLAVDAALPGFITHDRDAIADAVTSVILNYANKLATFEASDVRTALESAIELSSPGMAEKSWEIANQVVKRMTAEREYDPRDSEYERATVSSLRILVPCTRNPDMLRVACVDIPKKPPSHEPARLLDWILHRLHAEQLGAELFAVLMAVPYRSDGTLWPEEILAAVRAFYNGRWSPDIDELYAEMEANHVLLDSWERGNKLLPESDPISPDRVDRLPRTILNYYTRKLEDWQSGRQAAALRDDDGNPVTPESEYYQAERDYAVRKLGALIENLRKEASKLDEAETVAPSGPKLHGTRRTLITDDDAFDRLTEIEGPAWSEEQRKADYDPYGFFMNLEAFKTLQEMGLDKQGYMIVDVMPEGGGFLGADGTGYAILPDGEIVVLAESASEDKRAKIIRHLRIIGADKTI